MPDTLTQEQRRRCMSHIRSKNTRPEILVRHELFRRGYRYRINVNKLPGRPDIVLPKYKTVILDVSGTDMKDASILFCRNQI